MTMVDVANVESNCAQENISPGVVIRDDYGNQIETLRVTEMGHFVAPCGTIAAEDVGEYILRISKHPKVSR